MRTLLVVLFCLTSSAALAAGAALTVGETTYFLSLSDSGATCGTPEVVGDTDLLELTCTAGNSIVVADSHGCQRLEGKGYCASVPVGSNPEHGIELGCENGKRYLLLAGSSAVSCLAGDEAMRCRSVDGKSEAAATCKTGCTEARGAGRCCLTGARGCPPGYDPESAE
jgi:hypothetical protein